MGIVKFLTGAIMGALLLLSSVSAVGTPLASPPPLRAPGMPPTMSSVALPPVTIPPVTIPPMSTAMHPVMPVKPSTALASSDFSITISGKNVEDAAFVAHIGVIVYQAWEIRKKEGDTEAFKFLASQFLTYQACKKAIEIVGPKIGNPIVTTALSVGCHVSLPQIVNKDTVKVWFGKGMESHDSANFIADQALQMLQVTNKVLVVATHVKYHVDNRDDLVNFHISHKQLSVLNNGERPDVVYFLFYEEGLHVTHVQVKHAYKATSRNFENIIFPKKGSTSSKLSASAFGDFQKFNLDVEFKFQ